MKLLRAIQAFLTPPPLTMDLAPIRDAHANELFEQKEWFESQIKNLITEHCEERQQWARDKRLLTMERDRALEREAAARRAVDNTQALMTPHLAGGMTCVGSVANHRMQLDVPADSGIEPYELLAGFAYLIQDAGMELTDDSWPMSLPDLLLYTPPLLPTVKSAALLESQKVHKRTTLIGVSTRRPNMISPGPGAGQ